MVTFEDTALLTELAELLWRFPGVLAAARSCVASRCYYSLLHALLPALARAAPPSVYVVGGRSGKRPASDLPLAGFLTLDTGRDIWTTLPSMQRNRESCAVVAVSGNIYVIGGCCDTAQQVALSAAERFRIAEQKWERLPDAPSPRIKAAGTYLTLVYICGGLGEDGMPVAVLDALDASAQVWFQTPPMPTARSACGVAGLSGNVFVIGGVDDGWRCRSSAERYDIARNSWCTLPEMPTPRNECAAAAACGKVFVAGGITDWALQDVVECYDPCTDAWDTVSPLTKARRNFSMVAAAETLFVFGGVTHGGRCTASSESFDIGHGIWKLRAPMPEPRFNCGCAASWC